MTVTATDFITQAEKTLLADKNEISIRCSVKNSYYGAYHRVRSILECPIPEYIGMGVHRGFTEYLTSEAHRHEKNIPKIQLRKFAIVLAQLKAERHKADYDLDSNLSSEHGTIQLETAKKLMIDCDNLERKGAS